MLRIKERNKKKQVTSSWSLFIQRSSIVPYPAVWPRLCSDLSFRFSERYAEMTGMPASVCRITQLAFSHETGRRHWRLLWLERVRLWDYEVFDEWHQSRLYTLTSEKKCAERNTSGALAPFFPLGFETVNFRTLKVPFIECNVSFDVSHSTQHSYKNSACLVNRLAIIFFVLQTVNLSIILVINQINA